MSDNLVSVYQDAGIGRLCGLKLYPPLILEPAELDLFLDRMESALGRLAP